MLNPGNLSTLRTDLINKEEILEYSKKYGLFKEEQATISDKQIQNLRVDN